MKKNNFDILRILLATIVMFFHIGVLADIEPLHIFPGELAVHCFFVISGFLITKSYIRNPDLKCYVKSRFMRIFPLYALVIIGSYLLGGLITSVELDQYYYDGLRYLAFNLSFLNFIQPSLPGVFTGIDQYSAVNGSLWTIKIEVMFYISVPIIYGYLTRFVCKKNLTVIFAFLSVSCFYLLSYFTEKYDLNGSLNNQLPSLMSYFMVGAYCNFIKLEKRVLTMLLPLSFFAIYFEVHIFMPIATGVLVMYLAFCTPIINFSEKIGDLSYGVYIWHFPVIQTFIWFGIFSDPYSAVANVTFTVFVLAYISWHLLEKRCLYRKQLSVVKISI